MCDGDDMRRQRHATTTRSTPPGTCCEQQATHGALTGRHQQKKQVIQRLEEVARGVRGYQYIRRTQLHRNESAWQTPLHDPGTLTMRRAHSQDIPGASSRASSVKNLQLHNVPIVLCGERGTAGAGSQVTLALRKRGRSLHVFLVLPYAKGAAVRSVVDRSSLAFRRHEKRKWCGGKRRGREQHEKGFL